MVRAVAQRYDLIQAEQCRNRASLHPWADSVRRPYCVICF
jgi:hypothetical protein